MKHFARLQWYSELVLPKWYLFFMVSGHFLELSNTRPYLNMNLSPQRECEFLANMNCVLYCYIVLHIHGLTNELIKEQVTESVSNW